MESAALRGALWITLIALVATGIALTLQYVQMTQVLAERTRSQVEDEATALVARYQANGIQGVAVAIQRQQTLPRVNEFFYLLTLPDGRPIAGNLVTWPEGVDRTGFHSFTTDVVNSRGVTSRRWVEARVVILSGGFRLLVGNFADARMTLRSRYLSGLLWSLGVTGTLGLVLGFWYSRRGLRFVDQASEAGQRFLRGRLDERLPVSRRGDEYDRLAIMLNGMFAEIGRLVSSLRVATDGLAHDLRTPLTRIRARFELARPALSEGDEMAALLEDTRADLDTLLRLIEGTLSLARAEATTAVSFEPVRLDRIVEEAVDLYRPVAEDRGVEIVAVLQSASVPGSPALLAQLVANLIDNAVKYAPRDAGTVEVQLAGAGDHVRFVVADNGPGIPADQRDRALMRFNRLDQSRSSAGSGLGLSIVEVVVRVHGGRLALLDNQPGLRVEIILPASAG